MVIWRNFGARRYAQCLCADRQLRHWTGSFTANSTKVHRIFLNKLSKQVPQSKVIWNTNWWVLPQAPLPWGMHYEGSSRNTWLACSLPIVPFSDGRGRRAMQSCRVQLEGVKTSLKVCRRQVFRLWGEYIPLQCLVEAPAPSLTIVLCYGCLQPVGDNREYLFKV